MGLKAPRGWGWLTNPRKAAYNRVYNRTTIDLFALGRHSRKSGCLVMLALLGVLTALAVSAAVRYPSVSSVLSVSPFVSPISLKHRCGIFRFVLET
jgi:hypothetical protein